MFRNPRVWPAILIIAFLLVSTDVYAQQVGNPFAPGAGAAQRPAPPANPAQKHFMAGVQFMQKNKVDEALAEFQAAKKLMPKEPAVLMNIGVCYLRKKNLSGAESAFRQAYALDPKAALPPLTQTLIMQGKETQALPYLKKMAAANPKDFQTRVMIGGVYMKTKDYSSAASAFKAALAIKPTDKASLYNLALAQMNMKKYADARQALAKSLNVSWDPQTAGLDAYVCEQMGDKKAAIAAYEKIAAKHVPNVSRDAWMSIVRIYTGMNKQDEVLKTLKKAAASEPNDYDINLNLGRMLASKGQYKESQTYLLAARRSKSDVSINLFLAMNCLADPKTAPNAEKYVREAIRLKPKAPDQIELLAYVLQQQNKPEEAIAQYRKLEQMRPKDANPNVRIASVYMMMEGKGDAANAEYQKAMNKAPNEVNIAIAAASCLRSTNKADDAAALLQKVIAKNPKSEGARSSLADLYETQRKNDLAIEQYKKIAEVNPKATYAYQRMASGYDALKDYDNEIKVLRKLVEVDPKDTQAPMAIARTYQKWGKLDEGIAEIKKLVEANPKDFSARSLYGDLLIEKKDYDGAITQYTELTKNETPAMKAYAYYLLGGAREKQGKTDEAIAAYKSSCETVIMSSQSSLEALKKIYDAQKKPEELLSFCKTLIAKADENAPYGYFLTVFKDANKNDEALKLLEEIGQKKPDSRAIRMALGKAYFDTGAKDKAIEQYKALLAKDSKDIEAELSLCEVYKSMDKNDEAVACYQNVLKQVPNYPSVRIGLGDLYGKMGKKTEAIAEYEAVLKLQPGSIDIKNKIHALKGEQPEPVAIPGPVVGPTPAPGATTPAPTPAPGGATPAPTPAPTTDTGAAVTAPTANPAPATTPETAPK